MDRINWGIVGAGHIARRFAESLAHEPSSRLVAVSGRRAEKLTAFCAAHPDVTADACVYADDELGGDGAGAKALLADSRVDAIYLALPHGMHVEWAVRALRAGKAVLCEKPAVLSAGEAREISATAQETGNLFMEAMKCRFVPLHKRICAALDADGLGAVTGVVAVQKVDYGEARGGYLVDKKQGGALYDLGCYCASWVEEFLPGDISLNGVDVRWRKVTRPGADPYRVDWADDARFAIGGKPAHLVCDGAAPFESLVTIACERGRIEVERLHRPETARVILADGTVRELNAPYDHDDFYGEIEHFCKLLRTGAKESPVMPLAATIRNAQIIDAIRAEYATGK